MVKDLVENLELVFDSDYWSDIREQMSGCRRPATEGDIIREGALQRLMKLRKDEVKQRQECSEFKYLLECPVRADKQLEMIRMRFLYKGGTQESAHFLQVPALPLVSYAFGNWVFRLPIFMML